MPFKPDIIASLYYNYKVPHEVLSLCEYKAFNCHPSLLPNYKGCSSLTWAMANQEPYCGYTYHYMTNKLDGGNIILQKPIRLRSYDLQVNLYQRVMFEASEMLPLVLDMVLGGFDGMPQSGEGCSYKRGAPYDGIIQDHWDVLRVKSFIKAMTHPPLRPALYNGNEILSYQDYINHKRQLLDSL